MNTFENWSTLEANLKFLQFTAPTLQERDDAEELKRRAALEEELAAQSMDDEGKSAAPSGTSMIQSDSSAVRQGQMVDSKVKTTDEPIVIVPEKDYLAMKARLDAMEDKMKLLESVRPGVTSVIPPTSEANPQT